jgi:hypothetical protein
MKEINIIHFTPRGKAEFFMVHCNFLLPNGKFYEKVGDAQAAVNRRKELQRAPLAFNIRTKEYRLA